MKISRSESADPLRTSMLLALLLGGALVLCAVCVADPDLWGHVRYGQDVLASERLPATATYTFTASGYPWINHEILSEIIFGAVMSHTGPAGLLALRALLAFAVLGLMIASACRRGARPLVISVVVMLAAFTISPGWSLRPQLFTYAFFALLVAILDRSAPPANAPDAAQPNLLWTVPPLFAVWANTHGGFVAAWCLLALYIGCRTVEAFRQPGGWLGAPVARYWLVLAMSALATLLNPYGIHLLVWLIRDLGAPRPEIGEWQVLGLSDIRFIPFAVTLALATAVFVSKRPFDLAQTALLAVTAYESLLHLRHLPFFGILVGFWLPAPAEVLLARFRKRQTDAPRGPTPTRWVSTARALVWLAIAVLAVALVARLRTIWVNKSTYPVEAFRYMADHGLVGKLVVRFDWAQYAIAAFAPATTVAFDGRFRTCYPQELADMDFDFELGDLPGQRWRSDQSPPIDGARVLEFGHPDLVLLSRRAAHAVATMRRQTDWVLLYQDGLAQLWGRRARYDAAESQDYVPSAERSITEQPQSGIVPWPALPLRRPTRSTTVAAD